MTVHVLKPGLLSSLQDAGRTGHAAIGVGRAGAMDGPAWQLANALVGNRGDEAAIECTLLGPTLRFDSATWIALTGAPISARIGELEVPQWTACAVPSGSILQLGGMPIGCRSYLAVQGGFDVPPVLGSRSSDLHAGLGYEGGRALRGGDVLPLGVIEKLLPALTRPERPAPLSWGLDPQPWFDFAQTPIELLHGSHWDQLDISSQQNLFEQRFLLSKDSNRTASRLDGQTLKLRSPLEMISEAALPGTMQLPSSGQPIILMAEAPVTGGYPRIGQVAAVDMPRLAQRRPGAAVSFRQVSLEHALSRLLERQQALNRVLGYLARRLEQPP
jgi:biotin-dependent carboxylase-like uncharacterized protein